MTIYEGMKRDISDANEEWNYDSEKKAHYLLERMRTKALVDIAESLAAIRANGLTIETFKGGI